MVENFMRTLETWSAKALFFVQNYRYLFLDKVVCIYRATHSVIFSSFAVCSIKVVKQNGYQLFFCNGKNQLAKVVPHGTCFPLDPCNMTKRSLNPSSMTEVSMENI